MSRLKKPRFLDNDEHFAAGAPPLDVQHACLAHVTWQARALGGEATPSYCRWLGALERTRDHPGVLRFDFDTRGSRRHGADFGPMPEAARAHLRDLFAADRREVEVLLDWDCGDPAACGDPMTAGPQGPEV
jgi:hypothetical protein